MWCTKLLDLFEQVRTLACSRIQHSGRPRVGLAYVRMSMDYDQIFTQQLLENTCPLSQQLKLLVSA